MRIRWVLLTAVAIGAFLGGGWLLRRGLILMAPNGGATSATSRPAGSPNRLFSAVLETVRSHAVDSLDDPSIYRLATTGLLGELRDPYATFVSAADTVADRIGATPVQGVYLDRVEDFIEVVGVVPGSPAAVAGIRPGDAVIRVGLARIEYQRPEAVAAMIDGDSGTMVNVRLAREGGGAPLWVTIARGPVPQYSAPSINVDGAIAVLRVHKIDATAVAMIRTTVDSAARAGARRVVLDLRGVVEGSLADAVALAGGFLDRGQLIVTVRGRAGADSTVYRDQDPTPTVEIALVVLVDRGTAGAAEVVAAALQDHDRAVIVGEATFGRGGRQSYYPLPNGSILRLTTAFWVSPSGRVIQRQGPPPTEAPTDSAPPRPKFKTEAGRTVLGGGGVVPDREVSLGVEPSRATDPAMATARLLLSRATSRRALIAALPAN